jgi:shikimate kinase
MKLVLIGYRGTGKTVVSEGLGKRLNWPVFHTDELIVKKTGCSIPEIVKKWGWGKFRDIESEVITSVSAKEKCVIDTGGGVVLREENMKNLKKNGFIIWLTAPVEVIVERIKTSTDRPSLTGKKSFLEEVSEVLAERKEKYRQFAKLIIDTSRYSVKEVVEKILAEWKR